MMFFVCVGPFIIIFYLHTEFACFFKYIVIFSLAMSKYYLAYMFLFLCEVSAIADCQIKVFHKSLLHDWILDVTVLNNK